MLVALPALSLVLALAADSSGLPASESRALSRTKYGVGARPRAVVVADLNRDGLPDVVVANAGDGTASVLLGTGAGRLRPAVPPAIPAGPEPSDVDAADFDRDGDVDLVFANHETSTVTILFNDGGGHFTPAVGSPFGTGARPHVHGLATWDFDGDGLPDIAVESADTREVRVLRGSARGFGAVLTVPVGTMPYYRLGIADLDGDGRAEILVPGHGDSTVRVVQRVGGILKSAPWKIRLQDKPWMVAGDDVNGDRRADIVVVQSSGVSVWLAGRDGFSQASGSPFTVDGATEIATGDLDGDRVADVAIGPWDGAEVTLLLGRDLTARRLRVCERPIGLAIADLDGDGRGELLAACAAQDRLMVVRLEQ